MNIFYIGQLSSGGTCLDRMQALKRFGHEVAELDIHAYRPNSRVLRSIQYRLSPRLLLNTLNQDIQMLASRKGGFGCVWIDRGVWIFPETVELLKKKCGMVIHFTPDPQILFHRSRHFIASIPLYDHLITTKSFEVDLYKASGAKDVILSQQSYSPIRYANPVFDPMFSADIGFIGHFEKHYADAISRLAREFSKTYVWGIKWQRAANRGYLPSHAVKGDGLWQANYVNALASFKIGLGLLSKYIPEQHTTRSFEIPAAGTFLLAERTDEHKNFFDEGKEAEFFSDAEEMTSKAKFYLSNDAARHSIAKKGKERCIKSGYDIDSVLRRALAQVDIK